MSNFSKTAGLKASHKEMYKSPLRTAQLTNQTNESNDLNQSPTWRDAYKKRCFDEFKKSRQKLISKFRNVTLNDNSKTVIKDHLQEELEKICLLEAKTNPNLLTIEEAIEIYKQMQLEVIPTYEKDSEILEELIRIEEWEQKLVEETMSNRKIYHVICPICQKFDLTENNFEIVCSNSKYCNFKINKITTDLNLSKLEQCLDNSLKEHQCSENPQFKYKSEDSLDSTDKILLSHLSSNSSCFLIISCEKCQFMQSVV